MTRTPVLSPPVLPARAPEISAAAMAEALEGLRSRAEAGPPLIEERRSVAGRLGWVLAALVVSGGLAVPLRHVLFEAPSGGIGPSVAPGAAVAAAPPEAAGPVLARREPEPALPSIGPGAAMAAEPAVPAQPPPALALREPEPAPQASAPPALPMPLDLQLPLPPAVEVSGLADAPVVEPVAAPERTADAVPPSAPAVVEMAAAADMPAPAAVAVAVPEAPRIRVDIDETATLSLPPPGADADPRRTRTAALNVPSVASEAPSAVPSPPVPLPSVARGAPAAGNMDVEWLLARAQGLVREGDISGARLLLERAHAGGSRRAAFLLAETYDPRRLADWRALGIRGDAARARELYTKAKDGGIAEAGDRLLGLR